MDGILLFLALLLAPATLDHGRCSTCKRFHVESKVTMDGFVSCTAMYCGPGPTVYNEEGNVISQAASTPCNTCTEHGRCSRGHSVYSSSKGW